MSQTEKTIWSKGIKKGIRRLPAGKIIEIDEQIAAEYDIKVPVGPDIGGVHEIYPGKRHRLPQIVMYLKGIAFRFEIFAENLCRQMLDRAGGVKTTTRLGKDLGIDI